MPWTKDDERRWKETMGEWHKTDTFRLLFDHNRILSPLRGAFFSKLHDGTLEALDLLAGGHIRIANIGAVSMRAIAEIVAEERFSTPAKPRSPDGYRRASGVELYDARVKIELSTHDCVCLHEFYAPPVATICGDTIKDLAALFGLRLTYSPDQNGYIGNLEISAYPGWALYGEGHSLEIEKVLAAVLGPSLLSLKIYISREDGDSECVEMTYSGPFSVQWLDGGESEAND